MKEIYISKPTCEMINNAIERKQLSQKELAEKIGTSQSTMCRIRKGISTRIKFDVAKKLEIELDILISNAIDDQAELTNIILKLENENKILKQLLIEKWQKQ